MAEFLSLTCKSCGAKLEPTTKRDIFACPACGNEYLLQANGEIKAVGEQIVISGSQVNLGGQKAVECAICGKKNKPEDTFHCHTCDRDDLCARHQNPQTHQCADCTPLDGSTPRSGTNSVVGGLMECPVCGKRNSLEHSFRCRLCGRDGICISHQDPHLLLCPDCARKVGPEREALDAEHAYLAELEKVNAKKFKTQNSAYYMIAKHKGKAYRSEVYKGYYKRIGLPMFLILAAVGIIVFTLMKINEGTPMPAGCYPIIFLAILVGEISVINFGISGMIRDEVAHQRKVIADLEKKLGN